MSETIHTADHAYDVARLTGDKVVATLRIELRDTLNGEERVLLSRALGELHDPIDIAALIHHFEWESHCTGMGFKYPRPIPGMTAASRIANATVAEFMKCYNA